MSMNALFYRKVVVVVGLGHVRSRNSIIIYY